MDIFSCVVLFAWFFNFIRSNAFPAPIYCGVHTTSQNNNFPWEVEISSSHNGEILCSGVPITSRHVITTGICLISMEDPSEIIIHFPNAAYTDSIFNTTVKKIQFLDTEFNLEETLNQVAVLHMTEEIDLSYSQIRPICLPAIDQSIIDGTCSVNGLDLRSFTMKEISNLELAQSSIEDNDKSRELNETKDPIHLEIPILSLSSEYLNEFTQWEGFEENVRRKRDHIQEQGIYFESKEWDRIDPLFYPESDWIKSIPTDFQETDDIAFHKDQKMPGWVQSEEHGAMFRHKTKYNNGKIHQQKVIHLNPIDSDITEELRHLDMDKRNQNSTEIRFRSNLTLERSLDVGSSVRKLISVILEKNCSRTPEIKQVSEIIGVESSCIKPIAGSSPNAFCQVNLGSPVICKFSRNKKQIKSTETEITKYLGGIITWKRPCERSQLPQNDPYLQSLENVAYVRTIDTFLVKLLKLL